MAVSCTINGKAVTLLAEPESPALWAIREELDLTGTKYGCGVGACGACTIHVNGEAIRSCTLPVSEVEGKSLTTIEGLKPEGGELTALQSAWIKHQVPQCGYCQCGMIMAAEALIRRNPKPSDAQIGEAVSNICRCGTYAQVRAAIRDVTGQTKEASNG